MTQGCPDVIEVRNDYGDLVGWERCAHCTLDKLDTAIARDPVLYRAFDLDFALQAGIRLTLDEINVEEWRALKTLRTERDRYQAEQMKKQQKNNGR